MKTTAARQRETTVASLPQPEKLIGRDELASLLGINKRTLDRYRSDGTIPAPSIMIGSMPRWLPSTIAAWQNGERR